MIEFDESESNNEEPVKWWELLENTSGFVRFHYDEIMQSGSDELKRAVEIVLGGHPPARHKKGEPA